MLGRDKYDVYILVKWKSDCCNVCTYVRRVHLYLHPIYHCDLYRVLRWKEASQFIWSLWAFAGRQLWHSSGSSPKQYKYITSRNVYVWLVFVVCQTDADARLDVWNWRDEVETHLHHWLLSSLQIFTSVCQQYYSTTNWCGKFRDVAADLAWFPTTLRGVHMSRIVNLKARSLQSRINALQNAR